MTDCYHHWKPFLFLIYLFWYPKKESFVIFFTVLKTFLRNCLQEKVLKIAPEKNIERGLNPIFYAVKTGEIDARKIRELLLLLAKVES